MQVLFSQILIVVAVIVLLLTSAQIKTKQNLAMISYATHGKSSTMIMYNAINYCID